MNDTRIVRPGTPRGRFQVSAGVAAIRRSPEPDSEMTSQALHGELLTLFEERDGFGLVQLDRDAYVGWADMDALSAPVIAPNRRVAALRTYVFAEPDLKSAPRFLISRGGLVVAGEAEGRFVRCERAGWIVADHLCQLQDWALDPAAVAEGYVGAPYLWGGCESLGLDCTGLTQAAFGACGVQLPRDSDMQFAWAGEAVDDWEAPGALRRNDLVFWSGHVGILLDGDRLIHANAHHMACAVEPLATAVERIAALYGRPIGARRIDLPAARGSTPAWLAA